MKTLVSRFLKNESGATAIEYGLIAALIGIGIIIAATAVGGQLKATFSHIASALSTANSQ